MSKERVTPRQKDISRVLRERKGRLADKKKIFFARPRTIASLLFLIFSFGLISFSFAQEAKVFFSPQRGCTRAIISYLSQARQSVEIAMYSLTSDDITREIIRAKKRGVQVRIVYDKSQRGQKSSQIGFLKEQGVAARVYQGTGLMHNKFALIDDKILLTGSFNWTKNAEDGNAENLLVLSDKKLIAQYTKEFVHLWVQGEEEKTGKSFRQTTREIFKYFEKILRQIIKSLFRQIKGQHSF